MTPTEEQELKSFIQRAHEHPPASVMVVGTVHLCRSLMDCSQNFMSTPSPNLEVTVPVGFNAEPEVTLVFGFDPTFTCAFSPAEIDDLVALAHGESVVDARKLHARLKWIVECGLWKGFRLIGMLNVTPTKTGHAHGTGQPQVLLAASRCVYRVQIV